MPTSRGVVPQRRVAGFGADALLDQLEEARRAPDDVPCVVFRSLVFKAGTTVFAPRSRAEIEAIAKALSAVPAHRIEIGSRLGPGRPMASDVLLRSERARVVRLGLIGLGVAPDRMLLDPGEAYERVAEDVARASGGRAQSIGVCVHN